MKPRLLFLIGGDPRTSPRPAEAVRIAAGVAVWEKVEVRLCFRGPASLALHADAGELVDGELFAQHLPLLVGAGCRLYATEAGEVSASAVPFEAIEATGLAALAAGCSSVLRF